MANSAMAMAKFTMSMAKLATGMANFGKCCLGAITTHNSTTPPHQKRNN